MGLLIDTNVFIDIEHSRRGWEDLAENFIEYETAYISSITASELLVGVERMKGKAAIKTSVFVEKILDKIPVIGFGLQEARVYSKIWMKFLQRKEKGPGAHDLQIASTAISHGLPLLTSNLKDFKKVPGLEVLAL